MLVWGSLPLAAIASPPRQTNANLSEMLAKLKMHREQFHKLKQEAGDLKHECKEA